MKSPSTILLIEQNVDGTTGGSYRSMLYLVRLMDRSRFRPIAAFYREHDLLGAYREAAEKVLILRHPSPFDWARPWRSAATGRPYPLASIVLAAQKLANFFRMSVFQVARGVLLLARENVDVLHLNNGVTVGNELLLAAKLLGRKCVLHQRGILPIPKSNAMMARLADHILCVSDAARDNLIRSGIPAARCTTVHNGIDPGEFEAKIRTDPSTLRAELSIPPEAPVVGLAGMVREWKGQLVLLDAVRLLRPRYPSLRCILIGGVADQNASDQAYLARLHAFVRDHALGTSVQILDYSGNVGAYLRMFDVMVHAAIDPEPFSRVVLEGMTLGRPMVATATGGTPEAIEDGVSGLLIPPNDPAALAGGIARLLDDPGLRTRLGEGARRRIAERFLIRQNVAATEAIYESVLGG